MTSTKAIRVPAQKQYLLYEAVLDFIQERKPGVLVIEGEIAAGKSTLANELSTRVISMDDFYLPADRQPLDVCKEPGSHMDLARFQEEVLRSLHRETLTYQAFDCKKQEYNDKTLLSGECTLIEGNYAMMSCLGDYFDEAIFLEVSPELQKIRLQQRNGWDGYRRFSTRWIPASERYFAAEFVRERCGMRFIIE